MMMHLKLKQLAFACMLSALSLSAQAGGGVTGGSTEITQLANNLQLALQYAKQIQQYESQLKNLASLDQWVAVNPAASLNRLANVVQGGEALGMSSARIAAK